MFHTAPDPAKGEAEIMMEAETSSDATQGQGKGLAYYVR